MQTQTGLLYPLELAWTRLAADTAAKAEKRLYTGLLHCLQQTYYAEGPRGKQQALRHKSAYPSWSVRNLTQVCLLHKPFDRASTNLVQFSSVPRRLLDWYGPDDSCEAVL